MRPSAAALTLRCSTRPSVPLSVTLSCSVWRFTAAVMMRSLSDAPPLSRDVNTTTPTTTSATAAAAPIHFFFLSSSAARRSAILLRLGRALLEVIAVEDVLARGTFDLRACCCRLRTRATAPSSRAPARGSSSRGRSCSRATRGSSGSAPRSGRASGCPADFCSSCSAWRMLLCAAHVCRPLMYAGSFVGELGLFGSGMPRKESPWLLRQRPERAERGEELGRRVLLRERDRVARSRGRRSATGGDRLSRRRLPLGLPAGCSPDALLVGAAACSPGLDSW